MSKQTKHRYFNSFFITSFIYLFASFFLFYVFADTLIVEEKKPEEVKISIKHMMLQQEQTPVPPVVEPIQESVLPEPSPQPVVEKKIDKAKKEKKHKHKKTEHKKHHEKKPKEKPIVEKVQEIVDTKSEIVPNEKQVEKVVDTTPIDVKPQIDPVQIQNIEDAYLLKIRHLIEKNKTYPKVAKRLNQTGKVYVTFLITKDGEIKNCRIDKSSKFESLDEASIEILLKIANFEAIPKELNKSAWEITIPIVYQIN